MGVPVDLANTDSASNPIPLSTTTSIEILYGIPQEITDLQLDPGWNLVSTPAVSLQSLETIFGAIKTGTAWFWNGKQFQVAEENKPLNPEFGYWINSESGGMAIGYEGLFSDGLIQLQPKTWNLIGPINGSVPVPQNITSVLEWDSQQQTFKPPAQGMLNKGQGYWMFSATEATVQLSE